MKRNIVAVAALIASVIMAVIAYPLLPDSVPVHWNWRGEVDRYGSRLEAVLFGPLMVAGIWALFAIIDAFKARRKRPAQAEDATGMRARETIEAAAILLITAIHGFVLAHATGVSGDIRRGIALLIAFFLLVSGNVIGQVRRNRFVGVRTPWTLASDEVWRRTHRLTARLMVIAGILLAVAAFALPANGAVLAIIVLVIGSTIPPSIYSFFLWKREKRATPSA